MQQEQAEPCRHPKILHLMPPGRQAMCGYMGTCERPSRWHVMVPNEVMPEGWTGLLDPADVTYLTVCDDEEHQDYVVAAFPVRVVHEFDPEMCNREDTTFLDHACVEESPEYLRLQKQALAEPATV